MKGQKNALARIRARSRVPFQPFQHDGDLSQTGQEDQNGSFVVALLQNPDDDGKDEIIVDDFIVDTLQGPASEFTASRIAIRQLKTRQKDT